MFAGAELEVRRNWRIAWKPFFEGGVLVLPVRGVEQKGVRYREGKSGALQSARDGFRRAVVERYVVARGEVRVCGLFLLSQRISAN